ncbi:MAG: DUF1743 domain-containing protein [Methanobacteriota archaeon]|nr:MAG: DUF1743 domain-containing protein [Euryarchaeota archaeon]
MKLRIGIDDTDSKKGMCTTYLGAVLRDRLRSFAKVLELRLVRLNPNIPWKTRGNGAVALTVETGDYDRAVSETLEVVEDLAALDVEGTNPGVVIAKGDVPSELTSFYYNALHGVVTIEDAAALAEKHGCELHMFKEGRGIIGGLAAIGADLTDHTYEVIAYRTPEYWGRPRHVDPSSVYEMDRATRPATYNNVDPETGRILVTPRSPCPVLYGIRGTDREVLIRAMKMIRAGEPVERWALYKTNQGTDAHLKPCAIEEIEPYSSVIIRGVVSEAPRVIEGGHVIFSIAEGGCSVDCAAYEPTGGFREVVKRLCPGDVVRAYGGVTKENKTVNLEKLEVLDVKELFKLKNPVCPKCGKTMKSAGKGQGFRCRGCGTKAEAKEPVQIERDLKPGLYCVPERAMRHLSRPVVRI